MKKIVTKICSVLLIAVILVGLVPSVGTPIYAETKASTMASSMLNFFKSSNKISDVSTLSPDEIRVYAVFLSNFLKPGMFTLEDLNKGSDSELVKSVATKFFGNANDTANLDTIAGIHKIIYNTIIDGLNKEDSYTLYDTQTSTKPLTGKELLNKMSATNGDRNIYFSKDHTVCMDLSQPAIQGAFKLLASYSMDYMLGADGVANMSALYIDCFGNIWGAFQENLSVGEINIITTTEKSKLKLVMPACIDPLSFTSFADPNGSKPTQESLKLPLANAFAMGALVNTNDMNSNFKSSNDPYYNIFQYFASKDMTNILNIYGISSPLTSVLDTNSAVNNDMGLNSKVQTFFNNSLTKVNQGSTYIVLANNMTTVSSKLTHLTQDIKGINDKGALASYLYGTLKVDLSKVSDAMYYFGESDNAKWISDFSDLGMLGASLFTDGGVNTKTIATDDTFYSESSKTNKLTASLSQFYNQLGSTKLSTSTDKANVLILKDAVAKLASCIPPKDGSKVKVQMIQGYGQLAYILENMDGSGSNYDTVLADSKKYSNPNGNIEVPNISQATSALLYLMGTSLGETTLEMTSALDTYAYYNIAAYPIMLGASDATRLGCLTTANQYSKAKIATDKILWFFNWNEKDFIYSLTAGDSMAKSYLVGDSAFDACYGTSLLGTSNAQIFTTFHIYTLFSSYNISLSSSMTDNKVTGKLGNKDVSYNVNNMVADGTNNWPGIFFGYMVDILQFSEATKAATSKNGKTTFDSYSFTSEFLPAANIKVTGGPLDLSTFTGESGVANSDAQTDAEIQKDLIYKVYGIVSDTPNDYRNRWIKSTVDGFLLTIHRNITGSWFADMSTVSSGNGSTYTGVTGYINTPALSDLPFAAWIMNHYMQIYIIILMLIFVFLIMMVFLKMRTGQQSSTVFLLMCLALLAPSILIGNTINISNKVTDSIYSDRFDFWAMVQHQQSISNLQSAGGNEKAEIIAKTFEEAKTQYSGDAGVRIKWMSPKKSDVFNSMYTNANMSDSFATNLTIFKWLFSSFVYQSEFVGNDPLATYLYRPYNSIVAEAERYSELGQNNILKVSDTSSKDSSNATENKTVKFVNAQNKEFTADVNTYSIVSKVYDLAKNSERRTGYEKMFYAALIKDYNFFKTNNFANITYNDEKIADINAVGTYKKSSSTVDSVALWGMDSLDVNNVIFKDAGNWATSTKGIKSNLSDTTATSSMTADSAHLSAFLMNTESPYYYFYNTLKYRYGIADNFKTALLDRDIYTVRDAVLNSTSVSANGKIRDFLDLEGLFTYMIPYLSISNDYVYDWTKLNGTSIETYGFKSSDASLEAAQKKAAMEQVWNMYCPWVDQLNSLDKSQKVSIGTKSVRIENTLNPSYYLLAGRPMIFSEADMVAKGYRTSELTDVEMRLQKVLKDTYDDLTYLVNYYDMDNEVLLGAAAMYATFNFDKEFSQTSFLGESVMLYPQNFEMKNFNHDAFMRLALLNSTGEPIFGTTDLFERVMDKTSLFTGILLLVEDVAGVIAIPFLKLVLLLMMLFLGLLLCLTYVFQPPDKILKTVAKSVGLPAVLFMATTIAFALLVSGVVGSGLIAYVGSKTPSIATNDPTMTIVLLILFDALYIVALIKLIIMMFNSFKQYGPAFIQSAFGLVTDSVKNAVNKTKNRVGRVVNTIGGAAIGAATGGGAGAALGALNGAQGESVMSQMTSKLKQKRGANEYAKAMSGSARGGNSFQDRLNEKASASDGLKKQAYTRDGTALGNKLEDLAYYKNKFADRVSESKSNIKKTGNTISQIASGKYLEKSIQQGQARDASYKVARQKLDEKRNGVVSPSTADAINKMRGKK